jgi:APA family basic amino acid/polyamine antiporter
LNTFFAVAGVFILRFKQRAAGKEVVGYQTWGYPVTPILYLGLTGWTLVFILIERPKEAFAAALIILVGLMLYWVSERLGTDR